MNAARIAAALGGARREGRVRRCRCPLHGGASLTLRDGEGGCLLVTCWGGCDRFDVLAELRRLGLLGSDYQPRVVKTPQGDRTAGDASRTSRALAIWREARPIRETIAETYLRSRGISFDEWPKTLQFHPHCPHPTGVCLPARVALVEHVQHGKVAVHRTYLAADGSGKANVEPDKASLGPVRGGAVRFGAPSADKLLAVGEGIETTLSVVIACGLPGWAALSEGGM